jgi:putative ABC transport system permease protein
VSISIVLLVVTALLSVSFVRLANVDRGFQSDGVLAVGVAMPANRYTDERVRLVAYDRVLAAVAALPGVSSATTTSLIPLAGEGQINFIAAEGDRRARSEHPVANFRFVAPDFFRTLGVPILRGRAFTDRERDPNRPAPVVISRDAASKLWPNGDALGKRFGRSEIDEQHFEVVGIVGDARTTSLDRRPPLMVYVPYWWRSRSAATLLVKTGADPSSLMAPLRAAIHSIDPEIAIGDARPLEKIVDASLAPRRYQMRLFVTFGLIALLIAIVGVYATTAYGVSRRRREMNIRVALGAQPSDVIGLIVRQAGSPIAVGLAGGVVGAVAAGGLVASLLFDVRARDPIVIAGVAVIVGAAGIAACGAAARQNLVIDPAAALRDE